MNPIHALVHHANKQGLNSFVTLFASLQKPQPSFKKLCEKSWLKAMVVMLSMLFWMLPVQVYAAPTPALASAAPAPIVVMIDSAPATLNPFLASDAYGVRISHQLLYQSLLRLNANLQIEPGVFAEWKQLSPTKWRFQVKKNIRFHNGSSASAKDVVYTLKHFMNPKTGSVYGGTLREKIASIKATSSSQVEIVLSGSYAFLHDLILPLVSAQAGVATSNKTTPNGTASSTLPLGSGPYQLSKQDATSLTLIPHPYVAETKKPLPLVFKVVKDANTRLLKLRKGDIDLAINVVPLNKLRRFQKGSLKKRYQVIEGPGLSFQYIGFNLRNPVLQKPSVRKAIALGIPYQALIKHQLHGHGNRATGIFPAGSLFQDSKLPVFKQDPKLARQLLEKAGYSKAKRLTLSYKTSTDHNALSQARIIQNALKQIYIDVVIRSYEWGTFYHDIKTGNFQLYSLRWIGVSEPDFLYTLLHSKQTPPLGRNRGHYINAEVDTLLEKARITSIAPKRVPLYQQVHRFIYNELPYVPLWHVNNVAIIKKNLQAFQLHPSGGFEYLPQLRRKP